MYFTSSFTVSKIVRVASTDEFVHYRSLCKTTPPTPCALISLQVHENPAWTAQSSCLHRKRHSRIKIKAESLVCMDLPLSDALEETEYLWPLLSCTFVRWFTRQTWSLVGVNDDAAVAVRGTVSAPLMTVGSLFKSLRSGHVEKPNH